MNYLVVRTKLQAVIAYELLRLGEIAQPFVLIKTYHRYCGEDDPSVYAAYDKLATKAAAIREQSLGDGLFRSTARYIKWFCWSRATGGVFYVSNINWPVIALALKFVRSVTLRTFDDGSANVQNRNTSFLAQSNRRNSQSSLRRAINKVLFPNGTAYYVRQKIDLHYTIYAGLQNIVSGNRLRVIDLDWSEFLDSDDRSKLCEDVQTILVGTVYADCSGSSSLDTTKKLIESVDVFIPHPRDHFFRDHPSMLALSCPAESIINFYANQKDITVYHFNSSAVLPFLSDPRCDIFDLSDD